jgi:hypothetical protein
MKTVNSPSLVKVIDREAAEYLAASGFSYMKESNVFVFCATPELIAVLQRQFAKDQYIIENKLRF